MKLDLKSIFGGISAEKKKNIILVLGIAGIFLIFISNFIPPGKEETEEVNLPPGEPLTVDNYRKQLEEELAGIVSSIDGAGSVKILITMDSTTEDVFALEKNIDQKSQNTGGGESFDSESEYKEENEYVIIKNKDGSEQTVLRKQVMPTIRGVLVVCDGGGNSVTREKITKAVASVLNISSGKVYVTN